MYRAVTSFTTKDYEVRKKQILEDDFTSQDEINELITIGYIEEYDSSLEITENGTYNVKDYETAEVDVSSGGDKIFLPDGIKFGSSSTTVNDMSWIEDVDTSNITNMASFFKSCSKIENAPNMNTSNVTIMSSAFADCTSLKNVPIYNLININNNGLASMFQNCPSLSNDSLNNILKMCINTNPNKYTNRKTLKILGLSQTQATTCQGLSNWDAFVAAGWTSGY